MKKRHSLLLTVMACLLASCKFDFLYNVPAYPIQDGNMDAGGGEDTGIDDAGTYDIKIWCDQRIGDLTKTQVANFANASNGKYKINLTIDNQGEDSAAASMIEDVAEGADIFVFAQDQLSRLKTARALATITGDMRTAVINETEADGVAAASMNGNLYAFPFTSDNGYFMYYDKTIIKPGHEQNIEDIVADCKAAGKTINYSIFGNGFYGASYFMATGCESKWEIGDDNNFASYDDSYYSENGFIACKAIKFLKANNIFGNSDDPSKFGRAKNGLGACISGIWNYQYAYDAIGENLGCAPMPYFTVDGVKYHISSFSGYKLIGVKPQTDSKKVSVCKRIARYLSSKLCQTERFNIANWGPTNIAVLESDAVKSHPGLAALRAQKPYSKPQRQCPSSWFSSVSSLANAINANDSDQELWDALASYRDNLPSFLENQKGGAI